MGAYFEVKACEKRGLRSRKGFASSVRRFARRRTKKRYNMRWMRRTKERERARRNFGERRKGSRGAFLVLNLQSVYQLPQFRNSKKVYLVSPFPSRAVTASTNDIPPLTPRNTLNDARIAATLYLFDVRTMLSYLVGVGSRLCSVKDRLSMRSWRTLYSFALREARNAFCMTG